MIIAAIAFVAGGMYLFSRRIERVACTEEAKVCPDGNTVSRMPLTANLLNVPVKSVNVLNKSCEPHPIADYSATYTITFGATEKVIEFPGCENEMGQIGWLIEEMAGNETKKTFKRMGTIEIHARGTRSEEIVFDTGKKE